MTWMGRRLLPVMALLVATTADAAEPLVRVVMPTATPYLAGQPINLEVQILVPNFFMSSVQFPTLDIPGAVTTLSDDRASNFNEIVGGESYSGIRKGYVIVPEQAGTFSLPPAQLTFSYAAVPGQATRASVSMPAQTFEVRLPPGAMGPNGPLPMAPLEITQSWDRNLTGLRVGDTLTRTVSIFARGLQAMMIPPPRLDTPDRVKAYPHDAVLSSERTNGKDFAGGRRVDRVTYEFTTPGDYVLPAVTLDWYDVTTGKVEVARASELTVSIAAAATTAPAIAPDAPAADPAKSWRSIDWAFWLPRGAAALLTILVVVFASMRYLPLLLASLSARRRAYRQSEPAYFRRLMVACRTDDRMITYQALVAWAQVAGIKSISGWARRLGRSKLQNEIDRLEGDLFSGRQASSEWTARLLKRELAQARKELSGSRMRRGETMLPTLNPLWKSEARS